MMMNFPCAAPLWFTAHLNQVLTAAPSLVGTAWCLIQGEGIALLNLASMFNLDTGMLPHPGFGPADFSKITDEARAEISSLLSVLSLLCSAIPESAHSPTSLFNKNYFLSQLQAAEKINLNFP